MFTIISHLLLFSMERFQLDVVEDLVPSFQPMRIFQLLNRVKV
jgi:hypothetical protein